MNSSAGCSLLCDAEAGQQRHGFLVTKVTPVPALRCTACQAYHCHSGLRLIHLAATDRENLFAISFRTPPPDNTGVAHILEHAVLCGSRKFPVKDPFVEMLKGSMATFLNAMTYPDQTVFPVASNLKRDFFNLVDVYLDAVFHPSITPAVFGQEGHHSAFLRPGDLSSPLVVQGVVYNEMRGAYSDLDGLIERDSTQLLFPDSPYGLDSGGDPEQIPGLRYEQFLAFHRRFYSPTNAWVFLYGDIPTDEHLRFLDERFRLLSAPDGYADRVSIPRQTRWSEPREFEQTYPVGEHEPVCAQTAVSLNWVVGDMADPLTDLAMEALDRLLLGNAAAPLCKALIDSQLGDDLTESGYSSGSLETTFHVGLKGTEPERRDRIVALVLDTLRHVVEHGFAPELVDIAFNQLRYEHQEIVSSFPLHVMDAVLSACTHDLDPLVALHTQQHLDKLHQRYRDDPALFSRLVKERLIDNPHRLTLTFCPDPKLQRRRDRASAARLKKYKRTLSPGQLAAIDRRAAELRCLQDTPNTPEALATLPRLRLSDLPPEPQPLSTRSMTLRNGIRLLDTDVFANGINYLVLAFDLEGLPTELVPYVPVLANVLSKMGTTTHPYERMAKRIAGSTGGFGAGTFVGTPAQAPDKLLTFFTVHFNAVDGTYASALAIAAELLAELDLFDAKRLGDVLAQRKVQLRSDVIPNGHRFASSHAGRNLSAVACLSEQWGGVPQVILAERLVGTFPQRAAVVAHHLGAILEFVRNRATVVASFVGSRQYVDVTCQWLEGFRNFSAIASSAVPQPMTRQQLITGCLREGLVTASDVSFCALCMPAPHASHADSTLLQIFTQLVSYDYLWEEVRVKGGAYDGSAHYDALAQVFELLSYRDPGIDRTLRTFDGLLRYVRTAPWRQQDIEYAAVGCAKVDEQPIRPPTAVTTALWRHLTGVTEKLRQQRRQALRSAHADAVRNAGLRLLEQGIEQANVCALGSTGALAEANRGLAVPLTLEPFMSVDTDDQSCADIS